MTKEKNVERNKKKKDVRVLFKEDCKALTLREISLKGLFLKVDELLEYTLTGYFDRRQLLEQIALLDSIEFARVVVFCLDVFETIDLTNFLDDKDIDNELSTNLRFLAAKYGPKYHQTLDEAINEYGWRNIRYSVIQNSDDSYLLEFNVYLSNGSEVIIRDDAESMLQLTSFLIDGLYRLNKLNAIDQEDIKPVAESINKLLDNKE
ncbi:hypothetical protein [Desulfosporosinus sp. BG]|uniref:hypothetical protein n=1 Tax=Desulfosporosinus sp. BG TaxID=1633135 RepID=UPI00083A1E4C|nr:hypothetical protein [Desulfosporosinus sp. BG]ODA39983.1 hypothetical protein DSBG_3274 [Desulfosporosinus sp. BG]